MANAVYQKLGTTKKFRSSTGDAVITCTSLANGAGRISARLDLGDASATARPTRFHVFVKLKPTSSPTVGTALVRIYLIASVSGSGDAAGTFGTGDAAVSSEDSFRNAIPVGAVQCDVASASSFQAWLPMVDLPERYVQVGVWNALGVAFSATALDTDIWLVPVYDEIQ